jgi:hypothetical protein
MKKSSFGGEGLLDRIRSTGFALLGATALLGLVIVAIMAQQGVPYLAPLPIPGHGGGEAVAPATLATRPADELALAPRAGVGAVGHRTSIFAGSEAGGSPTGAGGSLTSGLAGGRQLGDSPGLAPAPGAGQPSGGSGSQPEPVPVPPESQPAVGSEPVPAPPAAPHPPPASAAAVAAVAAAAETQATAPDEQGEVEPEAPVVEIEEAAEPPAPDPEPSPPPAADPAEIEAEIVAEPVVVPEEPVPPTTPVTAPASDG